MAETKKQAVGWRESIGELTEYYLKNSKDEKKVKKINKRINKKATIIQWRFTRSKARKSLNYTADAKKLI